jgi:hypothetical protein
MRSSCIKHLYVQIADALRLLDIASLIASEKLQLHLFLIGSIRGGHQTNGAYAGNGPSGRFSHLKDELMRMPEVNVLYLFF